MKTLRILGIRGLPAAYGGFETFAEHLSLYLREKGWRVVVYCQETGSGKITTDTWQGIERVRIPVRGHGPKAAMLFDAKAIWHASKHKDLCLTLGYNTAVFNVLLRLKGIPNIINMDGIEWSRAKWGPLARLWLWANDHIGCKVGNHLVADHPCIKSHLTTRVRENKITMIPYGAARIDASTDQPLQSLGLEPGKYLTVIARPEPENSILQIVKAFSARPRGYKLAVLGQFYNGNAYHREVRQAASDEVAFLGPIYDQDIVQPLRYHAVAYIHGHQVGGTNPSLVEAMGAGNAVIAHDNRFNRWVAGTGAAYFHSVGSLKKLLDDLLPNPDKLQGMQQSSRQRFEDALTWPIVLQSYEQLLERFLPAPVN